MSKMRVAVESLADHPVADAITERGKELPIHATAGDARDLLGSASVRLVPLLDDDGSYVASVTREAIEQADDDTVLASIATATVPTATASTPLRDVLPTLDADGGRRLVVIDDDGSYVGLVCLRSRRQELCVGAGCHAEAATIDPGSTVAAIVLEQPARARVFERLGIDYCCGGNVPLAEACRAADLDAGEVVALLEAERSDAETEPDWRTEPIEALVAHILDAHHAYLKAELPPLAALVDKVARVHGDTHPELHDVQRTFMAIDMELRSHMPKEEVVLFPACLALSAGETTDVDLGGPIAVMLHEHAEVGDDLARLRRLTAAYAAPDDACTSYRTMLDRLAALEADTHQHIHEENNILFPRALALAGDVR